jgi:hypothetical protein
VTNFVYLFLPSLAKNSLVIFGFLFEILKKLIFSLLALIVPYFIGLTYIPSFLDSAGTKYYLTHCKKIYFELKA